ncbi:hypothetical protein [Clostridium ljungdahlii]|uniref:Uncharacterized protein n=1 Tax=Clostridium ljungdahlii TaxID=1538 RepID=A0A166RRU9_9CLOT|nr:hypothetical protein [Clostridium ljungdahlii]OAA91048.1 hypothetical protein WY13_00878 [Clostridium ljungdahlii]
MNESVDNVLWVNLLKSNGIFLDEENIALLKDISNPKVLKKDMFFLQEGGIRCLII